MAELPNIGEFKAQGLMEPVWVGMWDADGNLVLLAVRDLPKDAQALGRVLRIFRAVGEDAARRIGGGCQVRLPVLAALTGPN